MTKQSFAAMILGGTGQVGGAVVEELLAIPECREVVMVTRKRQSAFGNQHSAKPTTKSQTGERQRQEPIAARSRVRNVILDTGTADFAQRTADLAREALSQGPVSAVSCVGVEIRVPPHGGTVEGSPP